MKNNEGYTDYYPYGMVMPNRQYTLGSRYRFGYQGQFAEKDEETGLDHFEARDYDSRLGRWLVPDPAGQHWSPYLAMGNNPVSGVDPDGREYANPTNAFQRWWNNKTGFGFLNNTNYIEGVECKSYIPFQIKDKSGNWIRNKHHPSYERDRSFLNRADRWVRHIGNPELAEKELKWAREHTADILSLTATSVVTAGLATVGYLTIGSIALTSISVADDAHSLMGSPLEKKWKGTIWVETGSDAIGIVAPLLDPRWPLQIPTVATESYSFIKRTQQLQKK